MVTNVYTKSKYDQLRIDKTLLIYQDNKNKKIRVHTVAINVAYL